MSKEIDERVVSMQFDNKNFEKNVQTSMSTLDKLKAKLNLSGASKGLEDVSNASRKVDFSGLSKGIDVVSAKFSALQVVGVTALANITNSAVNAGKNIVKSFTLDPITSGFQEYETQMGAIQTILANTQSKGSTLDDVTKALDELNEYADQTIYNFTEMTKNIGTFTAAGVDLDKSVTSIKGIANLAAVSGSTSVQASTAMYQLSQALAAGRVSLMDWNSVVNAGMGGEVFQTALKRTATQMGHDVDGLIKKYGSFRESLTRGQWLTAEVLTETLTQLSGAYTEADLIAQGYTEKQAKEIVDLAKTAVGAATDVKTFTQLMDTLKEAVGSGWAQTWRIIFGDFEEAKVLFTGLSNFFGGFINKTSEARNNLLKGAFESSPFGELAKKIETVTGVTDEMTKATQKYGEVVDKVIGGEFGNGQKRFDALTKAGYDWAYVQNLVNERLGDSTRHATNFKESQDGLNNTQKTTVEQLIAMSDAQLKNLGFTEKEIEAFNELEKQSKLTGIPIKDLLKDMNQLNGRTLLINSFKNAGSGLVTVLTSIGKAYREMFPPMTSDQLYSIIAGIHRFSTYLKMNVEDIDKFGTTANKLYRTFRGLFSILDMVTTIFGSGFKLAFKGISAILGAFDTDILGLTARIGDFLYTINQGFNGIVDNMVDGFIKGLQSNPIIQALIDLGKRMLTAIKGVLGIHSPSTEMFEIGQNVVQGFVNGIKAGLGYLINILKVVGGTVISVLGDIDWNKVLAVGVTVGLFYTMIKMANAIEALMSPLEGLGDMFEGVGAVLTAFSKTLKGLGFKFMAAGIKDIAIALAILVGAIWLLTKIDPASLWASIGALAALAAIIGVFAAAMTKYGPKEALSFTGFASSVLIISGALLLMTFALRRLEKTDPDKFGVILTGFTTIILALVGVLAAYRLMTLGPNAAAIEKAGSMFLKLSLSLLVMTAVIRIMSGMSASDIAKGSAAISAFVGIFALLSLVTNLSKDVSSLGSNLLKMSVAMLILVAVIKLISGLSASEILKGSAALLAFVGIFALLALITRLAGPGTMAKLGSTLIAMSVAIGILALTVKLLGTMSVGDIVKGTAALVAFTGVIALLTLITRLAKADMPKLGTTLLAMSVAIGILAGIAILLGLIDIGGLIKGITAVGLLSTFMALMIYASRGVEDIKGNLIVMAVAIGVMAAAAAALSFIDTKKLAGATAALSTMMLAFGGMSKLSGDMNASVKSLTTMAIMVGILASILFVMSQLPMDGAMEKSAALSLLLVSFSASLKLLGTTSSISKQALKTVGVMALILTGLGGVLYTLEQLKMESAMENAMALSTLLLAFSASVALLGLVGIASNGAVAGIEAMAVLIVAVGAVLAALAGLTYLFPDLEDFLDRGIPILEKISYAIGSFFGHLVGGFSAGVSSGLPAIGENLSAFIVNLQPGIQALRDIDDDAFVGMATLVAMMALISGATMMDTITSFMRLGGKSSMEIFGENITQLANIMVAFSDAIAGKIDAEAITAASTAGKALAEMQALLSVSDVFSFFGGETDLETFGEQIKAFGTAMVGFSNAVSADGAINAEAIEAAKNAAMILVELQKAVVPVGGIAQSLMGTQDLREFAAQIVAFGEAIVGFSAVVSADGAINSTAIESAKNAGMLMVELQKAVVPVGGIVQAFTGTQDLGYFGTQLKQFGSALVGFSSVVSQEGAINTTAIEAAKNAGLIMTELQNAIIPSGGVFAFFTGQDNLGYFGSQLRLYGQGLVAFSNIVSQGGINTESIEAAKNAGMLMAELDAAIPEDHWFDGKVSLDEFGVTLIGFGRGIKGFSDQVTGIDSGAITYAVVSARNLIELSRSMVGLDTSGIDAFKSVKTIGDSYKSFVNKVSGINYEEVSNAITSVNSLVASIRNMVGLDSSGVSSFSSAINSLAQTSIKSFTDQFNVSTTEIQNVGKTLISNVITGAKSKQDELKTKSLEIITYTIKAIEDKKTEFKTAGSTLITQLASGVTLKKEEVKNSFTTSLSEALTTIRNNYSSFKSAGSYLVDGFCAGITENTWKAEAKAAAMARAAADAAEEELDINSPSKVFYGIGAFAGKGFVNALGDYANKSYRAGSDMASSARNGLSKAIGKVADLVDSGINPNPTIRPVLDLSDIESGTRTIGDMLHMGSSVSVLSNVGSLSYAMNRNRMSSSNDDVVSAINKLRKDMGNIGGNSYSIGGITYDDGSNVSEAIKTLVRAAKIDRRT